MNDQLQKALAELFNQASSSVGSIIDFGKQEIPAVVREYIIYNGIVSAALAIAFIVVGLIAYFKMGSIAKKIEAAKVTARQAYRDKDPWAFVNGHVGSGITSFAYDQVQNASSTFFSVGKYFGLFIPIAFSMIPLFTTIKIIFAPRIYLIETAISIYSNIH